MMESREQRIATLATTLRSSGIAKSDSQARMMAEDMIGVEEHVQRDYEVEHTRASEYLQTAKNLGTPRQTVKPDVRQDAKPEIKPNTKMETLYTSRDASRTTPRPSQEYTDVNFGGKTINQAVEHDTHNSAIEAIKAQISRQEPKFVDAVPLDEAVPLDDVTPGYILHKDIEILPATEEESSNEKSSVDDLQIPAASPVSLPSVDDAFPVKDVIQDLKDEHDVVPDLPPAEPKLDAQKLIDMMEEDGKLEEHTREIKEKPKDVKPKEAYEENNIDLGNMFDFNKGTMRK